ncbi:MAG: serine/threonine protein kinase [Acidobacteriaceae bacterium]|nr:serine/threonine protein kinase [Acidobacteriaceae bacterium]
MTPEEWQHVKRILDAALDIAPDDQAAFLDQACEGDSALRSEVESLLVSFANSGTFIERPVAAPAHPVELDRLSPGTSLGPYRIVQLIAEGGMGAVYQAVREDEVYRKLMAVKIVRHCIYGEYALKHFTTERQILAHFDHPSIAKLFDAGALPDGRPYFVMEFIAGVQIDVWCDERRLSTRDRLELFLKVCAGVEYAHRNLVVHRDLKPGNILVSEDGEPKLLDFGIAKILEQNPLTGSPAGTITVLPMMTPEYASPEQVRGSLVNTATDIYSLGVLLYELLTGHHPYQLKGRMPHEAAQIICEHDPPRPSTVVRRTLPADPDTGTDALTPESVSATRDGRPSGLRRALAGDLDRIVLKALEKQPARRYSSVEKFADDIRRHLDGRPVEARGASWSYRSGKFARRHTAAVIATALVALSLIAGLVATTRERRRADNEAATATAVNDFLQSDLLAQASASVQARPDVKPDPDLKVRTALDRAAARIAGKFDSQPLVEASIRQTIGDAYLDLGLYSQARGQLERALDLRRHMLGAGHRDTLTSMHKLGVLDWYQGKYAQAEPLLSSVLEMRRRTLGQEHPDTASAMNDLALVEWYRGEYPRAEPLFTKALQIRSSLLGPEHPETLSTMNDLAGLYVHRGKYGEAETLFVKLVEVRRRVLGQEHPRTLLSMNNLAVVYWDEGKYPQAERLLSDVCDAKSRVLGPEHPETLSTMNNLAGLYRDQGKYQPAEALFTKVLEVRQRVMGQEHPDTLISINNLALLYLYEGRHAPAEALFLKALEARRRVLGEDHPDTLISLNNLAMLYVYQGKYAMAEPVYVSVIERQQRVLGAQHPRRMASINDLGELYLKQQKYAAAEPLLREALNSQKKTGIQTWVRYNSESLLGASLTGQEKYAEAEPLLLSGYEGMLQQKATIPWERQPALNNRVEWILRLYENWGKPDKLAKWREEPQLSTPAPASRNERQ